MDVGAVAEQRGAAVAAETFSRRARGARRALVDGAATLVWAPGGRPRVVFGFTIAGGRIAGIDLIGDPARLAELDVAILPE